MLCNEEKKIYFSGGKCTLISDSQVDFGKLSEEKLKSPFIGNSPNQVGWDTRRHLAKVYFLLDSLKNILWHRSRSVNLTPLFMTLSIFAVPQGIPWIWQMDKLLSEYHLQNIIWRCPRCFSSSIFLIQHRPRSPQLPKRTIQKNFPFPRIYISLRHVDQQEDNASFPTCKRF